jgi:hypothetical protein
MKPLIIVFIAAVGLLAAVTGIPRSHSISTVGRAGTASSSTLQDMQGGPRADKLPVDDFDDRSLVFPRESKRSAEGHAVDLQPGLANTSAPERAF